MTFEEEPPQGAPGWMVTYGDMMSLLLCFFVLLFSMGSTQQQKFQAMAEAMHQRFGDPTPKLELYPRLHPPLRSRKERWGPETWDRGQEFQTSQTETNHQADQRERMWMQHPGQVPTIGTVLVFASDEPTLSADHRQQLTKVAALFAGKANLIAVRGHADQASTHQRAAAAKPPDDWDIAYARCRAAMDFLSRQAGLDGDRFRLEVVGDNEPIYRGADPELLKRNARVELYLLNDLQGLSEE
jgi:chemotaxis protein MotB